MRSPLSLFQRHCVLALLAVWGGAMAACGAEFIQLDFPLEGREFTSPHLAAPPRQLSRFDGVGYTEIYLGQPAEGESLLITVVFEEVPEESPALFWVDAQTGRQTTLSADLSDGVMGLNQRTILVSPEVASGPGRLVISGNQTLIKRVRLDWASPTEVLAAADQRPTRFLSSDRGFGAADLSGDRALSPPDAWYGDVLEASLQDEPAPMQDGLELVVPLPQAVDRALFRASILGLPLDGEVEVWVNGSPAGTLHPEIPSLTDPGYVEGAGGKVTYSGWRDASLLISVSLLGEGDNSIILKPTDPHAYVREATLQLKASHVIAQPPTDGLVIEETQDLAPR